MLLLDYVIFHIGKIKDLAISPNNKWLALSPQQKEMAIFSLQTNRVLFSLPGVHTSST